MRQTLVSGLLLATVAGCIVVNPKAPLDDRGTSSRSAVAPPGAMTGWRPPAAPGATLPATPVAVKAAAPSTTESAYSPTGSGQLPPTTAQVAQNSSPASGSQPATPAKVPPAAFGSAPRTGPIIPASYAEVVRTDADGLSATTLRGTPPPPPSLPTSLTSEHAPVQELAPTTVASAPAIRMVNSKRFTLNYEIKDAGSGGAPTVDLWCTQDLHQWKKFDATPQGPHSYVVEVKDEGQYGFTLVARPGQGEAKPPQPGDQPQVWVTVDSTKPVVQLTGLEVSLTAKVPSLIVRWSARDKNFGPRPVTLSYAAQPEGPWMLIGENVENTGRYEWPIPANMPPSMYVRVGAMDLVGNCGEVQTPNPIHIDANWVSAFSPSESGKAPTPPAPAPEPARPAVSIVNLEVNVTQSGAKE